MTALKQKECFLNITSGLWMTYTVNFKTFGKLWLK